MKRPDPILILALVVIAAIIGINVWNAKQNAATTTSGTEETGDAHGGEAMGEAPAVAEEYLLPSAFSDLAEAESAINVSQGKTGAAGNLEQIVYGVVRDPDAANIFYFATSSNTPEGNFVGIYRYNETNNNWTRLYKEVYPPTVANGPARLHVLGLDGRRLVIGESWVKDLLEPCASPFLALASFKAINLDQRAGLEAYELSEATREAAREREAACRAE